MCRRGNYNRQRPPRRILPQCFRIFPADENSEALDGKASCLVGLEIGPPPHPWMEFAGMFKDDSWIDDWVKSMAEYRQEVEHDPTR